MALNALIPDLLDRDWWNAWDYPSRIMDQCFASVLVDEDLLSPRIHKGHMVRPRTQANVAASGKSEVTNDSTKFQVSLNVSQFKLEEIKVKVVNNYVEVHGKHEEKVDEHGFVTREFMRRYMLPHNCEGDTVTSSLSNNGVLTIVAPKKALEEAPKRVREVPVVEDSAK